MTPGSRRLRLSRMETFLNPRRLASWTRPALTLNHRFDKLGNPLPMELHGCGCGLCAQQKRALLKFWEA